VNGKTTWFRIVVGRPGELRVRDNFGGRQVRWNRSGVLKKGRDYFLLVRKGEVVEAAIGPAGRSRPL